MKILNNLTIKHLTFNKRRTIVTIIGIILSTALMVGIGLLCSSLRDYMIKQVKENNGEYHVKLFNVNEKQYNELKYIDKISKIDYIESKYFTKNQSYSFIITESSNSFLEKLKLIDGRLPENNNEVVLPYYLTEYKIGDNLDLKLGEFNIESNFKELYKIDKYDVVLEKKYKVVGFVKDYAYSTYVPVGTFIYTKDDKIDTFNISAYITYSNTKDIYNKTERILDDIKYKPKEANDISYNSSLLALYGESKYNNFNSFIITIMVIVLSLVSIGCIMVIYNSFAISVMERKKQFGLLSSIGTNKKQILYTVFFEALIVGTIGITTGILGAFLGIGTVLYIINKLIQEVLIFPFTLSIYPVFIIIPIVFMIVVIILSALIPSVRAARVSPISAIRQHDDIKINKNKIKINKIIKYLFGIEGEIALKNIKRNKRKYRITVISLFVSIILFVSFSTFLKYGLDNTDDYLNMVEYDFALTLVSNDEEKINKTYKQISKYNEINNIIKFSSSNVLINPIEENFTEQYKNNFCNQECSVDLMNIILIDNKTYNEYLNLLNKKEHKPIFINNIEGINYKDGNRVLYKLDVFKDSTNINFTINALEYDIDEEKNESFEKYINLYKINEMYVTNKKIFGIKDIINSSNPTILISNEIYNSIKNEISENYYDILPKQDNYSILVKTSDNKSFDKKIDDLIKNSDMKIYSININEELKLMKNMVLIIKLLLYGFISLITLIGITSVLNTINTSIVLRKKEFAILRSLGLSR
ncbi:MAG TPA: FtsX-like permease family protein, partial [Tenericutes bacterium]|nr:FtsX-like permease family protein [Mycoplasmatota bacterium]